MKGMSEKLFPSNLYNVALFILPKQAFRHKKFTTSFFFNTLFHAFNAGILEDIPLSHLMLDFMLFLMQAEVAEKREG